MTSMPGRRREWGAAVLAGFLLAAGPAVAGEPLGNPFDGIRWKQGNTMLEGVGRGAIKVGAGLRNRIGWEENLVRGFTPTPTFSIGTTMQVLGANATGGGADEAGSGIVITTCRFGTVMDPFDRTGLYATLVGTRTNPDTAQLEVGYWGKICLDPECQTHQLHASEIFGPGSLWTPTWLGATYDGTSRTTLMVDFGAGPVGRQVDNPTGCTTLSAPFLGIGALAGSQNPMTFTEINARFTDIRFGGQVVVGADPTLPRTGTWPPPGTRVGGQIAHVQLRYVRPPGGPLPTSFQAWLGGQDVTGAVIQAGELGDDGTRATLTIRDVPLDIFALGFSYELGVGTDFTVRDGIWFAP